MNKEKNGLELLLLLDLTLATMEEYKLKGVVKNKANLFRNAVEKSVNDAMDKNSELDEEFTNNAINLKQRMIKQIASFNEADNILLSEFVNKFYNNIDIARKKGVVFFDKLMN